nr:TA system toxin CbtA family protein [uncultured Enterobacter sp.]
MHTSESRPLTPVESWQKLLTWLLAKHYGLALSETPFDDPAVIGGYIDADVSLVDALNEWVKCVAITRIDTPPFHWREPTPYIELIDILQAQQWVKL